MFIHYLQHANSIQKSASSTNPKMEAACSSKTSVFMQCLPLRCAKLQDVIWVVWLKMVKMAST